MGDSDDERDYKRRDKFHTERRDGGGFGGGEWREPRPGPPHPGYGGGGFRGRPPHPGQGYGGEFRGGRERGGGGYSPERGGRRHDLSPPPKRMRGGWGEEDRYGGGNGGGYEEREYDRPPPPRHYNRPSKPKEEDMEGFQPAMMSFKSFLSTQDDQISDEDAIKKYAEYKLEFKRQQLNEFFVTHKDEEWFKQKYHPDESVKRKGELRAMLQKRVEVFQELVSQGQMDISLDGDKSDALVRILDSVVIKLEGGTDLDLTVLDLPDPDDKKQDEKPRKSTDSRGDDKFDDENAALMKKAKEFLNFMEPSEKEKKAEEEPKKRKREEDDVEESNEDRDNNDPKTEVELDMKDAENEALSKDDDKGENESPQKKDEDEGKVSEKETDQATDEEKSPSKETVKPRALHKTSSIFLRNLAPTITKQEVEAMCKRFDGFLRCAIADPAPDRRWFRRGWVTFVRNVKIKDICFNLNNIRLRDCELGPIVNRDLTRRVRTAPGLTQDKKVVRNDIKLAAKIITNLDKKWGLWQSEGANKEEVSLGLVSTNPLLANITDYLIEEASAEEEELLGMKEGEEADGSEEGSNIQRDEELILVLDKMILYLRIVHSVDFYNHSEYPNEDEMPNRCGILHARASAPVNKVLIALKWTK